MMTCSHLTHISSLVPFEEIQWYLQDLATLPVLSQEAEQAVIQQIAADPCSQEASAARHLLVQANLRYVVPLARCYVLFGLEFADLIQEGNLALFQAAQQFDPQRNKHFKPFALRRVRRSLSLVVKTHLQKRHWLEPESETRHLLPAKVLKALVGNAIDEYALVLDLPEERFVSLEAFLEALPSGDASPDDRFPAHFLADEVAVDTNVLKRECERCIAGCLQTLTLRERVVLVHRYLLGFWQSREAVAKTLHITYQRVRKLEEQGLQKLRHPRNATVLRDFL
jgi:RNA polymerase primary sigma factor